jgi:hypothetical protein
MRGGVNGHRPAAARAFERQGLNAKTTRSAAHVPRSDAPRLDHPRRRCLHPPWFAESERERAEKRLAVGKICAGAARAGAVGL